MHITELLTTNLYFMGFFDPLKKVVWEMIWGIFVMAPLNIINSFEFVLQYLAGGVVNDLMFGGQDVFSLEHLPMQFWWFVITAVVLFTVVFVIQVIVIQFKSHVENKTKFVQCILNSFKAFAFMFLIPIFFLVANYGIKSFASLLIGSFGNGSTLADYLYHIGDPNGLTGATPSNFAPPSNIMDYNLFIEIFGVFFMFFAICMVGLQLVQKVIELFFLFVISPVVCIIMVIDDGKRAYIWKDMVIAKFLATTAVVIGFYVFIAALQAVVSNGMTGLGGDWSAKSLFLLLFMAGGGLAMLSFSTIIASLTGEAVGISEGMSSIKSTMAAGMFAAGAAKMTAKAFGFGKNKKAQLAAQKAGLGGLGSDGSSSMPYGQQVMEQNMQNGIQVPQRRTAGLFARPGLARAFAAAAAITAGTASTVATLYHAGKAGGVKGVVKQIGQGVSKPFVKLGRALNPAILTEVRGTRETKQILLKNANSKIEKFNSKLNKYDIDDKKYAKYMNKLKNANDFKNKIDNHIIRSEVEREWKKGGKKSTSTGSDLKNKFSYGDKYTTSNEKNGKK
ncbi:Mbov_0396 family ICE element transmembrane protein [Spiroplasma sp. DGKH1]|uniref:Mbov_0396 family ICE element transmembrane protein n=1 Tax=Spiroplasma sp. DGKH1 TaxID=3050074 RepID=UPI0034C615BC